VLVGRTALASRNKALPARVPTFLTKQMAGSSRFEDGLRIRPLCVLSGRHCLVPAA